jgi:hypothetical protein
MTTFMPVILELPRVEQFGLSTDKAVRIFSLPTKSPSSAAPCRVEEDAEKDEEEDPDEAAKEVASHPPLGFLNCFNFSIT